MPSIIRAPTATDGGWTDSQEALNDEGATEPDPDELPDERVLIFGGA